MRLRALLLGLPLLAGCASIVEGTTQEIYVDLVPMAAECTAWRLDRAGEVMAGAYNPSTRSIHVMKSRNDLVIRCQAQGYRNKEVRLVSNASGWGLAGAFFIDFGLVDYATGALNKYDASIQIVMEREEAVSEVLPPAPFVARQPAPAAQTGIQAPDTGPITRLQIGPREP